MVKAVHPLDITPQYTNPHILALAKDLVGRMCDTQKENANESVS
jgi:hypothetical protein